MVLNWLAAYNMFMHGAQTAMRGRRPLPALEDPLLLAAYRIEGFTPHWVKPPNGSPHPHIALAPPI